ncbi:hypothetical protein BS50DRAFT_482800 [Corynespora cassiicola Philippines]|uniref:DUF218 domain-containing protein n=1 Tax=Corynespora cassiicola Philippines TaxID=1448308 RepID=A0A2T2P6U0_CORCC|nr:hypothetical protein BS50DRAFT_482800 [Corynespora cassiicola Philippines]
MTPATASTALPKSKHHHTIATAPAGGPAPAATPDEAPQPPSVVPARQDTDASAGSSYPDHVVPPRDYSGVEHLVIVCCHAIFHPDASSPDFPLHSPFDEGNWHLAPFQRSDPETGKPGEHETFLAHIQAGLDDITSGSYAASSILMFSGGVTKASLSSLSEARSYYHAALGLSLAQGQHAGGRASHLFGKGRILLEEHATDSFQNLLFSILLFQRTTGRYPKQIRIVTHAFKSKRFLDLHAPAIRWPTNRIQVQGVDPVLSKDELQDTLRGEEQYGYAPWQDDPFGIGEFLSQKRRHRGWNEAVHHELGDGLEDGVRRLLDGEPSDDLPWTAQSSAEQPKAG